MCEDVKKKKKVSIIEKLQLWMNGKPSDYRTNKEDKNGTKKHTGFYFLIAILSNMTKLVTFVTAVLFLPAFPGKVAISVTLVAFVCQRK